MALQKAITTRFEFTANYLKVQNVMTHTNGDIELRGLILLYKDQKQRELNHNSYIDAATFNFEITREESAKDSRATAYSKIKESILDKEGNETNKFNFTHSGEIELQDALDV